MAFSIKELESLSGIKAHTIRIWEQRYRFLKPDRTSTNIRMYNNEELKTLLSVALLNKYGFKISRIDEMNAEQRSHAILNLPQDEAREEYLLVQLIAYTIDLRHLQFEELLNQYIANHGIEKTIRQLVFQFLEKVGILWQTSRINPAQEHLVTNIIRQKIIRAIDALPPVYTESPLYLLFLPEDEHHELGLLFVYYLLKQRGIPVLYLGANVPLRDVQYVIQAKKPSVLYLHLTSFPRQFRFEKFLSQLSSSAGSSRILISGSLVRSYQKELPSNAEFLQSFAQVLTYIHSL